MISYKAIKNNSRLIEFEGTKELVLRNTISNIAKVPDLFDSKRLSPIHAQTTLWQF